MEVLRVAAAEQPLSGGNRKWPTARGAKEFDWDHVAEEALEAYTAAITAKWW